MVRFIPLVLGHKKLVHGPLDDEEQWTYEVVMAHVTEVDGAKVQNDLFGKQFSKAWVARIKGRVSADSVSFMKNSVPDDQLQKLKVIEVSTHAIRTAIYFADDLEVAMNELE